MTNAASLLGAFVGLPLVAFAFGWGILGKFTDLDDEERFAAAWGVGFGFLGLAEFLAFLTHAPQGLFNTGAALLMGILALLCQFGRRRDHPFAADFWWLAGLWALGVAHLVAVQALLPVYVGGDWWGDWRMHYQAAQVFLGTRSDDWAFMGQFTMASRTPLFNLVAAFGLSLTEEQFWVFQILASWMNWCFPAALYLILRDLGGARAGRFALLSAPLNLWMLHMAWFTWPKLLAAYFLLLGLHFYLTSLRMRHTNPAAAQRRFLLFWGSSLLGIMTHSVGIVYVAPLLLHAGFTAWRERNSWLRPRDIAALGLVAALVLGPWHVWLVARFGLEEISQASPVTIMRERLAQKLSNVALAWLGAVGQNVAGSVVPFADQTTRKATAWPGYLYLSATGMYFNLVTGAITLTLTAFLVVRAFQKRLCTSGSAAPARNVMWVFAGVGCAGAVLLHPDFSIHGLAHNAFFTSTILLVGWAWMVMARAPRGWRLAVGAGMLFEFLLMFWSHLWFTATPDFLDCTGFNVSGKQEGCLVFLNDLLGAPAHSGLVVAVIGTQTTLAALFLRAVWQPMIIGKPQPSEEVLAVNA